MLRARPFVVTLAALLMAGCAHPASSQAPAGLTLVTTTSILAALARPVVGTAGTVDSIVPVGASPETYQSTPQDVVKISRARVLVQNGSGLETWLAHTLDNAKARNLIIVTCTDGLPVREGNPHLWMDPVFAKRYVERIRDASIAADPTHAEQFRANAAHFGVELDRLADRTRRSIATIPPQNRTMLVFHNAWQYYNARFGLRTVGVLERSPGQEPNAGSLAALVDTARRNHVRAVFGEPEYNPKLLTALAASAGITKVNVLYDDSVGTGKVHDYISMIDADTQTIVAALR